MTRFTGVLLLMLSASCYPIAIGSAQQSASKQGTPSAYNAANAKTAFRIGQIVRDCADCPEMVAIPQPGRTEITTDYPPLFVARFELTWREYRVAMRDGGCVTPGGKRLKSYDLSDPRLNDNQPLSGVSRRDFQCYLDWINRKTGKSYRIPTPEEWEHAARAGTTSNFYWGDDLGFDHAVVGGHFDKQKITRRYPPSSIPDQRSVVSSALTFPVGSLPPNPWGLYDMVGNVREVVAREWDTDVQCIKRLDRELCNLIETRGGDGFRSESKGLISKSELTYFYHPDAAVGFRLVWN
jgi:formylglycine-generating enzyme required for sulfatase activity